MRFTLHTFESAEDWRQSAVRTIADDVRQTILEKGRCTIGLSGGSTPKLVYESLAGERIDWARTSVFLADERCVSADDPRSNQNLVHESLLSHISTTPATAFPDTSLPPDACADRYDGLLRTILGGQATDILVLGLGADGHTASLFPPVSFDPDNERLALHTTTDLFPVHDRISVSPRVLNAALRPIFLLRGEDKRRAWENMVTSPFDPIRHPAHSALVGENAVVLAYW